MEAGRCVQLESGLIVKRFAKCVAQNIINDSGVESGFGGGRSGHRSFGGRTKISAYWKIDGDG